MARTRRDQSTGVQVPFDKAAVRAALYHRVSTTDQDPTLAREELRSAAARLGATVVLDVEETGSGARNDRPGLQQLMEAARRGRVDLVLVWKLDRFGRSSLDLQANIQALKNAGVRFIATTQGLDIRPGGDAMSNLILTVLAGVAEFERDIIRERTKLGMAKAKAAGRVPGPKPMGAAPDPGNVLSMREQGLSWAQVAANLGCSSAAARRAVGAL